VPERDTVKPTHSTRYQLCRLDGPTLASLTPSDYKCLPIPSNASDIARKPNVKRQTTSIPIRTL
jgi:hypothetical protein